MLWLPCSWVSNSGYMLRWLVELQALIAKVCIIFFPSLAVSSFSFFWSFQVIVLLFQTHGKGKTFKQTPDDSLSESCVLKNSDFFSFQFKKKSLKKSFKTLVTASKFHFYLTNLTFCASPQLPQVLRVLQDPWEFEKYCPFIHKSLSLIH